MRYVITAALAFVFALAFANQVSASPVPVLHFDGTEQYQTNGQTWIRFKLSVVNRGQFPNKLFAAAPDLPPCGLNHNSARTWVDVMDGTTHARLYGFCALGSHDDLASLWFAVAVRAAHPASVYITMTDRQKSRTVTSNSVAIP